MDISSEVFDEGSSQSNPTGVPPRAEEIDRTLRYLGLKNFATAIERAAAAVFPNDKKSRYSQVFVLLISWETRDPNLPVEQEISALRQVLEDCYHYDIEEFQIPDIDSHAEVSEKVNSFVKVGNNSSSHLKIVYYAGHSRLSRSKELLWFAWVIIQNFYVILQLTYFTPACQLERIQNTLSWCGVESKDH